MKFSPKFVGITLIVMGCLSIISYIRNSQKTAISFSKDNQEIKTSKSPIKK